MFGQRGGYALVVKGAGRGGGFVLAGGDDGLQVLLLALLVAPVPVRGLRDLLRLVDGGLFDGVGAIHHGFPAASALGSERASRGAAMRSGARDASGCWAHGCRRGQASKREEARGKASASGRRSTALRFLNCWRSA